MQYFWEKKGWDKEDRHLKALAEAPFRRPFESIKLRPGLFTFRGPRQIGKSSWMKTLLAEAEPKKSYYVSCENIADYKELSEVFKALPERNIFFFDEITFVDQWWRAVKHELDSRADICVVLTGSHAFDVKKGMDQMPGRWGHGGQFELLPMSFNEFRKMRMQAGWPQLKRIDELELFFKIGGFPLALAEAGPTGKVPVKAREVYKKWLMGDLLKLGKQEVYLKEILGQLALTTTSTISLQKLAQKTQIGSHNTAIDYIEVLEACFALKTLYAFDADKSVPRFRKEKKFYFRDPLIYWLALEWADLPIPEVAYEQLAETVAHEELYRRYEKLGYYSDRSGEVDFFVPNKWAIEVKWREVPLTLSKSFRNLRCPNKIVWSKTNFLDEWPNTQPKV